MAENRQARRRRTAAEIQKIVAEFRSSGQTRREFCTRRGIPTSTLDFWLRRRAIAPASAAVIPVGILQTEDAMIELEFPSGVIVRVGRGTKTADLRVVLEALASC